MTGLGLSPIDTPLALAAPLPADDLSEPSWAPEPGMSTGEDVGTGRLFSYVLCADQLSPSHCTAPEYP